MFTEEFKIRIGSITKIYYLQIHFMTFVSKKVSESAADISGRHHCLIYLVIFVNTV